MLLQSIHSPEDLKKLPEKKLKILAQEIRNKIIEVVGHNGGHLASNLGVVELTIALHRIFNSPQDAIIWDVSHQSYPHKLLTGRYDIFPTLRTKNGISGFTRISESPHDYFDAGHASSSISSALGLLASWKLQGRDDKVVAIIGDGALTGGMAYEGLNHAGQLAENLIVIVNDNQMSISPNTGSISRYLSHLTMSVYYQTIRYKIDRFVDKIPYFNRFVGKLIFRMKRGLKGLLLTNNLFVDLGFEYVGPLNGHDIEQMERTLLRVKKIRKPVVIHVVTKKGKGFSPAENDPASFHGVGAFNITDGVMEKFDTLSFTEAFSRKIVALAEKDEKIVTITAAMSKGTGLDSFSRHFKSRFFDVGIAEEHAVTFAGGLAAGGLIPVVAIYSTFIQRSIDQIIEDIALQGRHVVFVFDRCGAVPSDGETHQGIFDISLLRPVPNITILSVSSENDLGICLDWAVHSAKGPVAIRWPKLSCPSEIPIFSKDIHVGRGLLLRSDDFAPAVSATLSYELEKKKSSVKKVLFVCTGSIYSEVRTAARSILLKGIPADIFILRFIKPFDESYFISIARQYDFVVFVEDGVRIGGISDYLDVVLHKNSYTSSVKTRIFAFPDHFTTNGSRSQILEEAGLDPECIAKSLISDIGKLKW
ncbi:MAG: 1-deoxy-D-xylulose-5-phosphate synthase [Treponema sp.]|nr:1-deoxy-D-xylulose-5-phosphate synthase [Treponema sp.]